MVLNRGAFIELYNSTELRIGRAGPGRGRYYQVDEMSPSSISRINKVLFDKVWSKDHFVGFDGRGRVLRLSLRWEYRHEKPQ